MGLVWVFKTSKRITPDKLTTRSYLRILLILSNRATPSWSSIQIHGPIGAILIHTTVLRKWFRETLCSPCPWSTLEDCLGYSAPGMPPRLLLSLPLVKVMASKWPGFHTDHHLLLQQFDMHVWERDESTIIIWLFFFSWEVRSCPVSRLWFS